MFVFALVGNVRPAERQHAGTGLPAWRLRTVSLSCFENKIKNFVCSNCTIHEFLCELNGVFFLNVHLGKLNHFKIGIE